MKHEEEHALQRIQNDEGDCKSLGRRRGLGGDAHHPREAQEDEECKPAAGLSQQGRPGPDSQNLEDDQRESGHVDAEDGGDGHEEEPGVDRVRPHPARVGIDREAVRS